MGVVVGVVAEGRAEIANKGVIGVVGVTGGWGEVIWVGTGDFGSTGTRGRSLSEGLYMGEKVRGTGHV